MEAAVWADDIKDVNATYFDSYHFTDVVYDPQYLFAAMTEPQKDVNSINVASSCMTVLKTNKEGITFERAFMARYLLHLVGDIHQPLHSVTMYNSTLKKGDAGGNALFYCRQLDNNCDPIKKQYEFAFLHGLHGFGTEKRRAHAPSSDYIRQGLHQQSRRLNNQTIPP